MNQKNSKAEEKHDKVRVSKADRPKSVGKTNWAALIVEERRDGNRK